MEIKRSVNRVKFFTQPTYDVIDGTIVVNGDIELDVLIEETRDMWTSVTPNTYRLNSEFDLDGVNRLLTNNVTITIKNKVYNAVVPLFGFGEESDVEEYSMWIPNNNTNHIHVGVFQPTMYERNRLISLIDHPNGLSLTIKYGNGSFTIIGNIASALGLDFSKPYYGSIYIPV